MKKITFVSLILLFASYMAIGQQRTISGTVTSEADRSTLPGVTVVVDGSTTGAVTDMDGNYSISARENDIHYFAAGHHATERYGVQALGEYLAQKFAVTHHFIDIDNPV